MKKENLLIIFTKNPERGKVKTRLARDIGDQRALEIYKFLLEHSYTITSSLQISKRVYYSEEIASDDLWDNDDFEKRLQKGEDLGIRMENAFREGFRDGFKRVIIIGSDLYEIETNDLLMAFSELENHNYVIGPARDGGYYLLGMNSLNSDIFKNKKWSTSTVFQETLENMEGSTIKQLRIQNDIDVLEDIKDHPAFQKFLDK